LSGLITPSLDEMVHVAREMERLGFKTPLLIGGAATSRVHTAVKIAPNYSHSAIHVIDASRSVPVVNQLTSDELQKPFMRKMKAEYEKVRKSHSRKKTEYISLEKARANKVHIDWDNTVITPPKKPGITVLDDFPIEDIRNYIDWKPFFKTWELAGNYPQIFENPKIGKEARKLYDDANQLLDKVINEKLLKAHGATGLFPANALGDDIELFTDENRDKVLNVFHTLRRQMQKPRGKPNHALSDYIAPKESGIKDYIGAFAVTAGIGVEQLARQFKEDNDEYNSIMIKALANRLAEAFAELLHEKVRREYWGYAPEENYANEELLKKRYRGIRPAPGYPPCPDHTEKLVLFELLDVEKNTGISLTENLAMYPAASVCGLYFAHPEARYFALGKIGKDQVLDYQKRKGITLAEVEKWLSPNLNYDIAAGDEVTDKNLYTN